MADSIGFRGGALEFKVQGTPNMPALLEDRQCIQHGHKELSQRCHEVGTASGVKWDKGLVFDNRLRP